MAEYRVLSQVECAELANYKFISSNQLSDVIKKNHKSVIRRDFGVIRNEIDYCNCPEIDGVKCSDRGCPNRGSHIACPPSCGAKCANSPWENKLFVICKKTYVKQMPGIGFGVFAAELIKRHEWIGEYTGVVIRRDEEVEGQAKHYVFAITGTKHMINPYKFGSATRLINHGCHPSCIARVVLHNGALKLVLKCIRDITPHTELTFAYNWESDDKESAMECHCGHDKCTGVIGTIAGDNKGKNKMQPCDDSDSDPEFVDIQNLSINAGDPKAFESVMKIYDPQVQDLLKTQPQQATRPEEYIEDHIFKALSTAYILVNVNNALRVICGRVTECFINPQGIYFYVVRTVTDGIMDYYIPHWISFHYLSDACFRLNDVLTEGEKEAVSLFTSNNSRRNANKLRANLVPDYAGKVINGLIPETVKERVEVEGAPSLGLADHTLVQRNDSSDKVQCKRPRTVIPASSVAKVVHSTEHYHASHHEELKPVIERNYNRIILRRLFDLTLETVTNFAMARLPASKANDYDRTYNKVRRDMDANYYLAEPEMQKFLHFNHFRLACDIRAPGAWKMNWCSLCPLPTTFGNENTLRRHYYNTHSMCAMLYVCPNCPDKTTNYPSEFRKHVEKCDPQFASSMCMVVESYVQDSYADFVACKDEKHKTLYIVQPGAPLTWNKGNRLHGTGNYSSSKILLMDPQKLLPVDVGERMATPVHFDIQKQCKTITDWSELNPSTNHEAAPKLKPKV